MESALPIKRNSHIDYGLIYFWTATINGWQRLLERDVYKQVIVDSLQFLSDKGKIDVFAFIIMPNHMHLIWRMNEPNGRESPQGSLLKYTAHIFRRMLLDEGINHLVHYTVGAANKEHEFWQRDPLAIPVFSYGVALQKLNYLHYNPLVEHWSLVKDPCDYWYSSARYYERNDKTFPFLKNLWGSCDRKRGAGYLVVRETRTTAAVVIERHFIYHHNFHPKECTFVLTI